MPLTACGTSLGGRHPDASLLTKCERPIAPSDNPTDNEVANAWNDAVEKYLICEAKHDALVYFFNGDK